MSFKMVFLSPVRTGTESMVARLQDSVPDAEIVVADEREAALRELADADAAFGTMDPTLIAAAPNLRWLQAPAAAPPAGYYFPELIEHQTQVTNFRGIYNDHISAHVMAMVLSFAKHMHRYRDQQLQAEWSPIAGEGANQVFLPESTALIVGVGGIGSETAKLCKAFGMKVVGVDARWEMPDVNEHLDVASGPEELDTHLTDADFVILTIPHTPETEGLFDATKFRLMRKTAYFINIGRGMTTKLHDLVDALEHGEIAGAGLDVYEIEPLPSDHPLWTMPNVILTPHVAAEEGRHLGERRYQVVAENMRRFANGETLLNVVDKASWF